MLDNLPTINQSNRFRQSFSEFSKGFAFEDEALIPIIDFIFIYIPSHMH